MGQDGQGHPERAGQRRRLWTTRCLNTEDNVQLLAGLVGGEGGQEVPTASDSAETTAQVWSGHCTRVPWRERWLHGTGVEYVQRCGLTVRDP